MLHIGTNQIALGLFLLLNLIIGLWTGRNVKTMKDYALANRSLGTGVLAMTLIATFIGGEYIQIINNASTHGLISSILPLLTAFIAAIFLQHNVFPHLVNYQECHTLGEVIYKLYGSKVRYLTVFISVFFTIFTVAAQFIAISRFSYFFGLHPRFFIIIIGIISITYTILGGMRSVASTDVLQFIFICIGITLLSHILLNKTELSIAGLFNNIQKNSPDKLAVWERFDFWDRFSGACFWRLFPTFFLAPAIVQRALMAKNKKDIKTILNWHLIFLFLLRSSILIIGFSAYLLPNITIAGENTVLIEILNNAIENRLIQIVVILTFIAMTMSTSDSQLNAVSVLVTNDYLNPILQGSTKYDLLRIRLISLLMGIASIGLALITIKVPINTIIVLAGAIFSTITIPFIFGVMGLKVNKKMFINSFAIFILTGLLLYLKNIKYYNGLEPNTFRRFIYYPLWTYAILASAITFFATHYYQYGKLLWIKRPKSINERVKEHMAKESGAGYAWYGWLSEPVAWSKQLLLKEGKPPYITFGLLLPLFYMIPSFSTQKVYPHGIESYQLIALLRFIGVGLCAGLLMVKLWPKKLKRYLPLYWGFTLTYTLPFTHLLIYLHNPTDRVALTFFFILQNALILLVRWRAYWLMQIAGTSCALLAHGLIIGEEAFSKIDFDMGWEWLVGSIALYGIHFLLGWIREKQYDHNLIQARTEEKERSKYLATYSSMLDQVSASIDPRASMMGVMRGALNRLAQVKDIKEVSGEVEKISRAMGHLELVSAQSQTHLPLVTRTINFNELLLIALRKIKQLKIPTHDIIVEENILPHALLHCDADYIHTLFLNGVRQLKENNPTQSILLSIDPTLLYYPIDERHIRKEAAWALTLTLGKVNPPMKKKYIFEEDGMTNVNSSQMKKNLLIVKAHYGISIIKQELQRYIIPCNVDHIRPKIMRFADEDLEKSTTLNKEDELLIDKAVKKHKFNKERITEALLFSKHAHRYQMRKSGEPFYTHPRKVAEKLLEDAKITENIFIGALLHDAVEDTAISIDQIAALFGEEVATLVNQVTHLYNQQNRKIRLEKKQSLDTLVNELNSGAFRIKMADRLHNLESIEVHERYKQEQIAKESRDFFLPLAKILKMTKEYNAMEKLVNSILQKKESSNKVLVPDQS